MRVLVTLVLNAYNVTLLNLKRRNIDLAAVDLDMPVIHELSSLSARRRETRTVNDIVQPTLEHEQKIFAGNAFLTKRLFEIITELLLEDEVDALYLLLFAKLLSIAGEHLTSSRTVLSGRVGSALFDRTGGFKAAIPLQK
jgi:hypothetical protein